MLEGTGCLPSWSHYVIYRKQTITHKMVDQERSDLHAVFTMILSGLNFSIWLVIKLIITN